MEYIVSLLWVSLELLNFALFSDAFLQRKRLHKEYILVFLFAWLIMFLYSRFIEDDFLKFLITIVTILIMSFFLYKGSWQRHLLSTLFVYAFSGIMDICIVYGVSILLNVSYKELVWKQLLYITVGTVAKLLCCLCAYLVRKIRKPFGAQSIKGRWLILTTLFPAISVLMLVTIFTTYKDKQDLSIATFIFSIFLAIANAAIIYLISIMEKSSRTEIEMALIKQQMEIQTEGFLTLEKSYMAQRKATHDFKNQLQTIHDLIEQSQVEAAIRYIQQLQDVKSLRVFGVNSRHTIIDVVLNQKYQVAMEKSIEMRIKVNDLSRVTLRTDSIVVLLSNLLDNAIEACQRLTTQGVIECSILADDNLFISIRNSSLPVSINEGVIESSKFPKEEHGYGLVSVKYILECLHAEYTFCYENGFFQFVADIPDVTYQNKIYD